MPLERLVSSIHEADREHAEARIEDAVESCGEYEEEYRVWNADDELRWVSAHGHVECDEDGNPVTFPGALTDITERKQFERQLEESNERLEQFAYAASHDLQEPLRMVSSYLQMIDRRYSDELDEDGEEFIDFAVDGAERMRDMIEGLLEYSRVDTRGGPFEPVDLDDILVDVRDDLQMTIVESDAEITTESLPRVDGDEGQLRQVFQNLLDNAIEYSGDESPQVHVSAERDGNKWMISVSDDGIGITRRTLTASSRCSRACTRTTNTRERGLDSRSASASSNATAVTFGSNPNQARDRRLCSRYPPTEHSE